MEYSHRNSLPAHCASRHRFDSSKTDYALGLAPVSRRAHGASAVSLSRCKMSGIVSSLPADGMLRVAKRFGYEDRQSTTPDPTRTAYHEAGHAIVGRHFGLPVKSVVILESHEGKTNFHDLAFDRGKLGMSDFQFNLSHAVSLVAGYVSEEMAMEDSESGCEKWTAIGLMTDAQPGTGEASLSSKEPTAGVMELETQTRTILEANWYLVQEFAAELERCKLLEDEPLADFLNRVVVRDN
jgi:hypothetical protein